MNESFKTFLDKLYDMISFLTSELSGNHKRLDEYRWSIVMDYILLKSMGENIISEYLSKNLGETYDIYKLIFLHKLKNTVSKYLRAADDKKSFVLSYFDEYLVNPFILCESLFLMRTDAELKIFFNLFGGGFCPQEQEIYDGTGALYFTESDFKPETNILKSKSKILQDHFKKSNNNIYFIAAQNNYAHWVAIEDMKDDFLKTYNPLWKGISTQRIINRSRFYLFYYNPTKAVILTEEFMKFFESEIEKEKKFLKDFTEKLTLEQNEEETHKKNITENQNDK